MQKYILPSLSIRPVQQPADRLVIHMRNGDIFLDPKTPGGSLYFQPPCSFYKKIIQEHPRFLDIVIVSEDTGSVGNPCVAALLDWHKDIKYERRSMEEDLAILLGAKNLVVSSGSFSSLTAIMSPFVENIFVPVLTRVLEHPLSTCPGLLTSNVYCFTMNPDYAFATWENTPEQRKQMVEYPLEKIVKMIQSVDK